MNPVALAISLGASIISGVGVALSNPKPLTGSKKLLSYQFSPDHIEIQKRIDIILGYNFKSRGMAVYNGGPSGYYCRPNGYGEFPNYTRLQCALTEQGVRENKTTLTQVRDMVRIVEQPVRGWEGVDPMHYGSPDEAMRKIFEMVTNSKAPSAFIAPVINPKDTYKAYQYPSPEVSRTYGNNLSYFVRCAPQNIGCQLIGKDISAKSFLVILGSLVATIATAGSASPALVAAVGAVTTAIKFATSTKTTEGAAQAAIDLVNIFNGADITTENGTVADVRAVADNFVQSNPQIFES